MDIHKDFPKTVDRKDFWRQIKRTVNGEPVSEESISMIVSTIKTKLELNSTKSHLLDLGCGNGALASRLFDSLCAYTGVDFSEYLIEVAQEFFQHKVVESYTTNDVQTYIKEEVNPERFTDILCYGVMAYLPKDSFSECLAKIHEKFGNTQRVFFGNIPDANKAQEFYAQREVSNYDLNDHQSAIGVWWAPEELVEIAANNHWIAEVSKMPDSFYASEYRYDLLLRRSR